MKMFQFMNYHLTPQTHKTSSLFRRKKISPQLCYFFPWESLGNENISINIIHIALSIYQNISEGHFPALLTLLVLFKSWWCLKFKIYNTIILCWSTRLGWYQHSKSRAHGPLLPIIFNTLTWASLTMYPNFPNIFCTMRNEHESSWGILESM